MIRKHSSSIPGHVCVVFELPASVWADRIYLTGDFNEWCENDLPLRQGRDGTWRVTLDLPVDQCFQFRYVVDGEWQTDWCADGAEENTFGSQNSVVTSELPTAKSKAEPAHTDRPAHNPAHDPVQAESIAPPPAYVSNRVRFPRSIDAVAAQIDQIASD